MNKEIPFVTKKSFKNFLQSFILKKVAQQLTWITNI